MTVIIVWIIFGVAAALLYSAFMGDGGGDES